MSTENLITKGGDPYINPTLDFLSCVFSKYKDPDFSFRLWDGTVWQLENAKAANFTIVLNHASALRRMFCPPSDTRLALAYMHGDFDIEGQAVLAFNLAHHLWQNWRWYDAVRAAVKLLALPSAPALSPAEPVAHLSGMEHSHDRDRQAIQFHYDISNEFYKLWLDRRMVYSCGYFRSPYATVDDAQFCKLEMLCRKLRLKEGDRLLDVGCGWGALVIHAAKHYRVKATGITLSEKQTELARHRVEKAGLSHLVAIELCDYRDMDEQNSFDKIVSVGMIEHIGRYNLKTYFIKMWRLLRPGGVMLNHGITLLHDIFKSLRQVRNGFFAKYIFPDGDLQPINYVQNFATGAGFEIRDVESLREHYALTLHAWLKRFEANENEIVKMVGRQSYRLWKLYLQGAGWGFETGLHSIYQTLLYKPDESGFGKSHLPLIRDDWYIAGIPEDNDPVDI